MSQTATCLSSRRRAACVGVYTRSPTCTPLATGTARQHPRGPSTVYGARSTRGAAHARARDGAGRTAHPPSLSPASLDVPWFALPACCAPAVSSVLTISPQGEGMPPPLVLTLRVPTALLLRGALGAAAATAALGCGYGVGATRWAQACARPAGCSCGPPRQERTGRRRRPPWRRRATRGRRRRRRATPRSTTFSAAA